LPDDSRQLAYEEELEVGLPTPIGVLRAWDDLPRYEDVINQQIADVQSKRGTGDLAKLLRGGDTWRVEAH
jgi:2-oxoglutarate/2-oxoacid ferredoxin oxidoreductase subunit beta